MGSWGITMRESDYGLDLLGTIAGTQLKATDFSTFNVADALEVIKADIMEEIRQANRDCSASEIVFYFSENFPRNFTQGALLIAECLADYYRTGELVIYDYAGENYDPVIHSLGNVVHDDTLIAPRHLNARKDGLARFDYIVSNPPFNMDFSDNRSDNRDELAGEKHKERFFAGVPSIPKKDKDSMAVYQLFIQHILHSLAPRGKAAIVVPTGFLTAGSGIPKKIREYLVTERMLRGVISMPSNIFATTGTSVSILFIDRENKDVYCSAKTDSSIQAGLKRLNCQIHYKGRR